ncbi:adenyl-nucleotide exchange factor sse1 [Ascosphaera acerosa]|nr:adenyl-nucleotide exchange factor sse1 [Ascosphaera acerosa]
MSVVGIDLGSQSTKIGVARNKGIDIITNEVSNRQTPTLVGFSPKCRYLGEAAKTQETSNLKNTVSNFKRLAGRTLSDADVATEQEFCSAKLVDVNGQAGAEVSYLGNTEQFTATQLVAMYLGKIKTTAQAELRAPVSDVVLSVPAWFTDAQRRALLDAADIAGLKPLRLMNDTTAIALGYGITKLDLPAADEKPRRVAFVDIGYADYTCSVVEFRKGELNVKATTYDRHFGGRNFDRALVDHLAAEFKDKFKVDVKSNPKALMRTYAAAEKLKKVLSANAVAPISIESVMEDTDVRAMVKREEFEEWIKPFLDRTTKPLDDALAQAGLTLDDLDSIEMIGGCTRVPAIKERLAAHFGKPLSFTLNQDEAVARGCAFACAILSPAFRVRDFAVHDIVNYPIDFTWEQAPDVPDEATSLTVFNTGNVMPSTKILTFYRKNPFDLEARYADPSALPGAMSPWIGRFSVKGVKPDAKDDFMVCKLKARLNLHGVLNIESGYYVEDVEIEEAIDAEGNVVDPASEDAEKRTVKTRKVKKQVRKGDLPISAGTHGLEDAVKQALAERENAMFMEDKLVADTEDKKNELEAFIYELRDKVDTTYSEFGNDEEKGAIKRKLDESEDWLYEDGDDTTKAAYVAKHEEILAVAAPVIGRYQAKLEEEREAKRKAEEAAAAKKAAEIAALRKAQEEAAARRKAEEEQRKKEEEEEAAKAAAAEGGAAAADADAMDTDAPAPASSEGDKKDGEDTEMKE